MKIFNEYKIEMNIEECDLTKGYLKNDKIIVHHDAVEGKPAKYHFEKIAEYTKGCSYKKVIDEEEIKPQLAYDEEEEIYIYTLYTDKELAQNSMKEIENWFDEEYTKQEQKLRRLITLKQKTDNDSDPYNELIALYNFAEGKRKEYQRLETIGLDIDSESEIDDKIEEQANNGIIY